VVTSIAILGVIGTGLGYVLYFRLIGEIGATAASAVNYLVPVTAVLISLATVRNPITWNIVVGALVVMGGVAFAENRAILTRVFGRTKPEPAKAVPVAVSSE
jgi:drug/metabolite transporter (DMT)-like permease